MEINGIILINKESGISSNSVVNKVKHVLGASKAGHLGTLDVLGRGLLPITLGKGTKLFDYFLNKDKIYLTTFKFGVTSDTLDREGVITNYNDVQVSKKDLIEVCKKFIGKMEQLPPIYSAKKIKGKKAYELARNGEDVILKPKLIEIFDIEVLEQIESNAFLLKVHCSSGTYIRSLCRDIANALGTYGIMQDILRTRCGDFDLKDSFSIQDVKNGNFKIISLDNLFNYDKLNINEDDKLLNGQKIKVEKSENKYRIYNSLNQFLGIGIIENGYLKLSLRLI